MTPAEVKRARARRGDGQLLHAELLDAAERLLIETGDPDRVSVRAIADAAGVSPPSIYLHFPDKETLLFAVSARQFAAIDARLERSAEGIADPAEALRARGRAYVCFGLERPEHYRILLMGKATNKPESFDPEQIPGSSAFTNFVAAVQRAIDAGALRADLDPVVTAIGFWATFHGITSLLIAIPDFPWPEVDRLVDHACETQLRGLRP
jgi:AcrR family transcriptional regulator